jgi:prevent-host-death family protein
MNIVGIKELKNQLTQYLRRTKKGQEVIITERGKPIAVIRPTEPCYRPARSSSVISGNRDLSKFINSSERM